MSIEDTERTVDQAFMEAVARTMQTLDDHVNRYVAQRLAECKVTTGVELQLSARERDVFPLILGGLANKEIAVRLGISERTAKFHVSSILRKCATTSRLDLVIKYKAAPNLQFVASS